MDWTKEEVISPDLVVQTFELDICGLRTVDWWQKFMADVPLDASIIVQAGWEDTCIMTITRYRKPTGQEITDYQNELTYAEERHIRDLIDQLMELDPNSLNPTLVADHQKRVAAYEKAFRRQL